MDIINDLIPVNESAKPPKELALVRADNGFARIYYRDAERRLYCYLQQSREVFELFACTKDGEPSYPVAEAGYVIDSLPTGDTSTEVAFRSWHKGRT